MNSVWDMKLGDFRDQTASHAPTPGGGSVAAVAAVEGLALVLMGLEVNLRRKEPHPESAGLLRRGKDLMKLLTSAADEDVDVFSKYMKALALPKTTPEEEQIRFRAISAAAANALESPLRAAERCLDALMLAREAMAAVHSGMASDVGGGAALIYGALTATLYNVDINLKSIETPAHFNEALATRKELQRRADELSYVIQKETLAKIAK